jgi:hypothetical protein
VVRKRTAGAIRLIAKLGLVVLITGLTSGCTSVGASPPAPGQSVNGQAADVDPEDRQLIRPESSAASH